MHAFKTIWLYAITILVMIVMSCTYVCAQYTVSYRYFQNDYKTWDASVVDAAFPRHHEVALGYYFKLPDYRVEFLPELAYALPTKSVLQGTNSHTASQSYVALSIPIHFYLFDMKDDCDCPTFAKQGPKFISSISMYIAPKAKYTLRNISGQKDKSTIVPSLGAGIAYDLGISNLITITPHVGAEMGFQDLWKSDVLNKNIFPKENVFSMVFGLRTTWRFDYVRKNRW